MAFGAKELGISQGKAQLLSTRKQLGANIKAYDQRLALVVELFFHFNRERKRGRRQGGMAGSTPWASSH